MKNLISLLFVLVCLSTSAQSKFDYGFKVGVALSNYVFHNQDNKIYYWDLDLIHIAPVVGLHAHLKLNQRFSGNSGIAWNRIGEKYDNNLEGGIIHRYVDMVYIPVTIDFNINVRENWIIKPTVGFKPNYFFRSRDISTSKINTYHFNPLKADPISKHPGVGNPMNRTTVQGTFGMRLKRKKSLMINALWHFGEFVTYTYTLGSQNQMLTSGFQISNLELSMTYFPFK